MLSVIIPAYNEQDSVLEAYKHISDTLQGLSIENEIIFVDDGSIDNTWQKIEQLVKDNNNVCGIHFSRNFGKDAAIYAGLEKSKGDCCVVLDCDMQHPPSKIADMYALWKKGYEIIEGVKISRGKERWLHRFAAKSFYSIIGSAIHTNMENASDFKLLDRKVVDVLTDMPEKGAFFRALSSWVGFKKATVEFEVCTRKSGKSKWTLSSLIKYAIQNISSFSSAPMHLVTLAGLIMLMVTFFLVIYAFFHSINTQFLFLTLLFSGGIILIGIGIMGYYLSRMYDEIKGRPKYIISYILEKKRDN